MSDLPIPFSAPMIRALIDGRKTQTRRSFSSLRGRQCRHISAFGRSDTPGYDWHFRDDGKRWHDLRHAELLPRLKYRIGDRLWVKEAWRIRSWDEDGGVWISYAADGANSRQLSPDNDDFFERLCTRAEKAGAKTNEDGCYVSVPASVLSRPAMFMPRWASRLTLTVTDVRVERLQAISEEDAIAEGIEDVTRNIASGDKSLRFWKRYKDGGWNGYVDTAVGSYASLWTEINGPGAWEANPWVVAYTFTARRGNIDDKGAAND